MIKQTVSELSELGLRPAVLQRWFGECSQYGGEGEGGGVGVGVGGSSVDVDDGRRREGRDGGVALPSSADDCCFDTRGRRRLPKIVYEFSEGDSRIEAQLRIPAESMEELSCGVKEDGEEGESVQDSDDNRDDDRDRVDVELMNECALFESPKAGSPGVGANDDDVLLDVEQGSGSGSGSGSETPIPIHQTPPPPTQEIIIPLTSSSAFFDLLYTTLEHMSVQLKAVETEFRAALEVLSSMIGDTARPVSRSSYSSSPGSGFLFLGGGAGGRVFRAVSPLKDHAGAIHVGRTDLSDVCTLFFFLWDESPFFNHLFMVE